MLDRQSSAGPDRMAASRAARPLKLTMTSFQTASYETARYYFMTSADPNGIRSRRLSGW